MANAAEKKRVKLEASTRGSYFLIMLGIQVIYALYRVLYHWASFSNWHTFAWFAMLLLNWFCSQAIYSAILGGYTYSYYQDVLWISWFVQVGSMWSDWMFMFYLVVPVFAIGKLGNTLFDSMFPNDSGTEQPMDEQTLKKMKKKERQMERAQKLQRR